MILGAHHFFCVFHFLPSIIYFPIVVTSSEAVTTTSQLQARLSQPPSATTGNRSQLSYLLQRGPAGGATSSPSSAGGPATAAAATASTALTAAVGAVSSSSTSNSSVTEAANQISLSASATNTLQTSTSSGGVTTTKVWVPGDLLLISMLVEAMYLLMIWVHHL